MERIFKIIIFLILLICLLLAGSFLAFLHIFED